MGVYRGIAQDNVTINSGRITATTFSTTAPVIKTANFTVAQNENNLICNGSGAITVTLPSAASWPGREIRIKTIAAQAVSSASSNVKPVTSDTAGTAILAGTDGEWAILVSDGSNWVVMAKG